MALLQRPPGSVHNIMVDRYVIALTNSEQQMMGCECGCCFSVVLQLPGGEHPTWIKCPCTAGLDDRDYARTVTEVLFSPLHSLGLAPTRDDHFFRYLCRFATDFSVVRHLPHSVSDGPQVVQVAHICVAAIEDVKLAWPVQTVKAQELEAGESCAICLQEYKRDQDQHQDQDRDQDQDRIARLPCRHVFHVDCISGWFDRSHVCPLCRFAMPAHHIQISTSSPQTLAS